MFGQLSVCSGIRRCISFILVCLRPLVRLLCPCHFACWFFVCPKPVTTYVCACVQVGAHMCVCKSLLLLCKTNAVYLCVSTYPVFPSFLLVLMIYIWVYVCIQEVLLCLFFSISVVAEFVLCKLVCLCVCFCHPLSCNISPTGSDTTESGR